MCTVITAIGLSSQWPILIAAVRDEATNRAWASPARHWPEYPDLLGGLDLVGGGTWLAVDQKACTAAFLVNRQGTKSSIVPRQSRGILPLQVLSSDSQWHAKDLAPFDGFILGKADSSGISIWEWDTHSLAHQKLSKGVSGICFRGVGAEHPRLQRHVPRFAAAPLPNPQCKEASSQAWGSWLHLFTDDETSPKDEATLLWTRIVNGCIWSSQSASCIAIGHNAIRFDFSDAPDCIDSWIPIIS